MFCCLDFVEILSMVSMISNKLLCFLVLVLVSSTIVLLLVISYWFCDVYSGHYWLLLVTAGFMT